MLTWKVAVSTTAILFTVMLNKQSISRVLFHPQAEATIIYLGITVTRQLKRLNPEGSAGRIIPSLFGLAPCGVYPSQPVTWLLVRSYRTFPPLPDKSGGLNLYGTIPKVTLAGRYPAHCPVEPGLSSSGSRPAAIVLTTYFNMKKYSTLRLICQIRC